MEDQKKRGRPGSIHDVSGHRVDMGGQGRYSNMHILNSKASFLWVKTSFEGLESKLKQMIQSIVLAVGNKASILLGFKSGDVYMRY